MHIRDFFENSLKQDSIFDTPKEDLDFAKELFEEYSQYV